MPEARTQVEGVSGQSSAICKDNTGISRNSLTKTGRALSISGQHSTADPQDHFFISLQCLVHPTPPTSTLTELVHPVH